MQDVYKNRNTSDPKFAVKLLPIGTVSFLSFLLFFYVSGGLLFSFICFAAVSFLLLVMYCIADHLIARSSNIEIKDEPKKNFFYYLLRWPYVIINIITLIGSYIIGVHYF